MTDCPSCGGPIKAGDWTCGNCGAPVAGAGGAPVGAGGAQGGGHSAPSDPSPYLPEYQTQAAGAGAPAPAASSGALRLVIIFAVVALIAIVAVWFFVIRGPKTNGDEFLGTWTGAGSITSVVVARPDDAFKVTLTGGQTSQQVTIPAHIDGTELVITIDDFATLAGEANADAFKDTLKALAGDFRLIFRSVDATHIQLRVEGTNTSGQSGDTTITLVKATP